MAGLRQQGLRLGDVALQRRQLGVLRVHLADVVVLADRSHAAVRELEVLRVVGCQNHRLAHRSEEHTSELQSLMRISYAVFCLKKKNKSLKTTHKTIPQTQLY